MTRKASADIAGGADHGGSGHTGPAPGHEHPGPPRHLLAADPAGWRAVDAALTSHLDTHEGMANRWLLIQTLATAVMRRSLLAGLGVRPGWRTLDVGTGFGALPMELAAMMPVDAVGIDIDESILLAAHDLRRDVAERGGFLTGSSVRFVTGDAFALDERDASVDLVTARFVYQHLRDHARATAELARVVRPGGLACLIDVDEGLSVTHPEPSPAYRRLRDALTAMQGQLGGGRCVGRTLPALLDQAGFDVQAVLVLPQASYRSSQPDDLARAHLVGRFLDARPALIEGYIPAPEFDDCLARFAAERTTGELVVEAHLAAVGRRR